MAQARLGPASAPDPVGVRLRPSVLSLLPLLLAVGLSRENGDSESENIAGEGGQESLLILGRPTAAFCLGRGVSRPAGVRATSGLFVLCNMSNKKIVRDV